MQNELDQLVTGAKQAYKAYNEKKESFMQDVLDQILLLEMWREEDENIYTAQITFMDMTTTSVTNKLPLVALVKVVEDAEEMLAKPTSC